MHRRVIKSKVHVYCKSWMIFFSLSIAIRLLISFSGSDIWKNRIAFIPFLAYILYFSAPLIGVLVFETSKFVGYMKREHNIKLSILDIHGYNSLGSDLRDPNVEYMRIDFKKLERFLIIALCLSIISSLIIYKL